MKTGTIGERLRSVRKLGGVSARQLAELAGLESPAHVGLIEHGDRPDPRSSTVEKLARTLGVTSDWLIAGIGKMPSGARVLAAVEKARARQQQAAR